jgi:hypothetical protein
MLNEPWGTLSYSTAYFMRKDIPVLFDIAEAVTVGDM